MQRKSVVAPLVILGFTIFAGLANADEFPEPSCRSSLTGIQYGQAGPRLCISIEQSAARYDVASQRCRRVSGHVCTYEDFFYLFTFTNLDVIKSPNGKWIGNITGDDEVLCGNTAITSDNDSDIQNFEGTCNKSNIRTYFCCNDDDVD